MTLIAPQIWTDPLHAFIAGAFDIDEEQALVNEPDRVKKVLDIQRYYMDNMFYIPVAVGYAYILQQPEMRKLYYTSTYGVGSESFLEAWIDKS